ncbi:MAG: CheR family methyltransferase [Campylobacterales bacterium]
MFDWLFKKNNSEEIVTDVKSTQDWSDFEKITEYLYKQSGIIDLEKKALSSSRIKHYALENKIYTTYQLLQALEDKGKIYQDIIDIVTVNETYFLRELKELNWLIEYIKNSDKSLKILSMPCSSGEEIYSILLLMLQKNIPLEKVELVGYDINSQMIQRAKEAIYDEHSLHNMEKSIIEKYFSKVEDNKYKLSSFITSHTFFKQQNIFEIDISKESYDIILSRNMLIYFDEEKREKAVDIILKMLKSDGIFLKGHADNIPTGYNLKNIALGVYKLQSF